MKIGLIIYSYTGNTLSVAEKIQTALIQKGHDAVLERITATNENPNSQQAIQLLNTPSTQAYDRVIFACPVNGFQVAAVAREYLKNVPMLSGMPIDLFVTHFFPFAFLGGNQTLKQLSAFWTQKGGKVEKTGVINWSSQRRIRDIEKLADKFSEL